VKSSYWLSFTASPCRKHNSHFMKLLKAILLMCQTNQINKLWLYLNISLYWCKLMI